MDDLNRRKFLGAAAGITASIASQAKADDQGDFVRSHATSLNGAGTDRDPLGLRSGQILTPEAVRRAIEQGVDFLKSSQRPNGTWPEQRHYDAGLTSLCTLALLNAGCDATDATIVAALTFLRGLVPRSTYTASLQTMVFCLADPRQDRALIERNVKWLESRQHPDGMQRGMWAVRSVRSTDHADNSMSHFALLALNEAGRVGVTVNPQTWTIALQHWQNTQNEDGSWGWGPTYPGSGSMTCAGIAALIIAGAALSTGDARLVGDQVQGCALQTPDPHFEAALAWLARYFSVERNPGSEFWLSYYCYALERAGRMTARRFFGNHDWYREGARMLVKTQEYSGAWPADVEFQKVGDKYVSTSFSLMFLAKGRWPVVVAHLKRRPSDDWNRHRAALTNLVGHMEKAWGRNLTHQVVDIERASVEELGEVPVLFINGREAPQFSAEEKRKLHDYVERGGFIFAEKCCDGAGFDSGFRAAMREIFPESDQALQLLPPDHPVWIAEQPIKPELPIWGIDVGCRTAVIYCPFDISCYWEFDRPGRERPELASAKDRLVTARDIGLNVLSYATGREVTFKNPAPVLAAATSTATPSERGAIQVANVIHPGGCHAAPAALRNLLRRAANDFHLHVNPEPGEVRLDGSNLFEYHALFFHGRMSFDLTDRERQGLRDYVERGGTVIADAVCSSGAFAESFRREMKGIFPEHSLEPVRGSDPIFTPAFGGADIRLVSRRTPKLATASKPSDAKSKSAPSLEAVTMNDRYAILFSPLDISCALETEPLGCSGYVRKDALLIAMNLLLYSLNQ